MSRAVEQGLRLVSLLLLALVGWQGVSATVAPDPLADVDLHALEVLAAETATKPADETETEQPATPAPKPPKPELPQRFQVIANSGVLGKPPPVVVAPPKLQGIGSDFAFIQAPNGKVDIVREGGEVGGVKVLKIGINRVLIEYQGKQTELTIHGGVGGESLKAAEGEKTDTKDKP